MTDSGPCSNHCLSEILFAFNLNVLYGTFSLAVRVPAFALEGKNFLSASRLRL